LTRAHARAILLVTGARLKRAEGHRLIVLFYAFAREIAPLRRRTVERHPIAHPHLHGIRARLHGRELAMIATGIGHARATRTAAHALEEFPGAEMVIATGVAGALSEELRPGDLVLTELVVAEALGEDIPRETAIAREHLDSAAAALAARQLRHVRGAMLTAGRVLPGAREKAAARSRTGAVAVDMETAALAAEAARRGVPFVSLRAILDAVGDEIVGPRIDETGRVRALATAGGLIRNPAALFKIPRMMKNLSVATAALADALEAIIASGSGTAAPRR
jgi:adenosylhomocysteine nucleosidase